MFKYLIESHNKREDRKEYKLYGVPVQVINKYPDNIKISNILSIVKTKLPPAFLNGLEIIYIGDFPELNDREIQAMLKDDAIWLSSNNIKNFLTEPLIAESIIHEIAHLVEERWKDFIYEDGAIQSEYDGKKQRLVDLLRGEGESVFSDLFFKDEYLSELDAFLYKTVGYDKLSLIASDLFLSPYSVTTIREYFADGFQAFFSPDRRYLKEISPLLYARIQNLVKEINNEY